VGLAIGYAAVVLIERGNEVGKVMPERLLRIQRWDEPYRGKEQAWSPQTEEKLVAYLRSLADGQTTTVVIEITEERWLSIDADKGRFSLGIQLGENAFNLIGDMATKGTVSFAVGGQLVQFPQGYLVTLDQVLEEVVTFFCTGTVDVTHKWLQQGPDDLWCREGLA
jgi:hypothetical protein